MNPIHDVPPDTVAFFLPSADELVFSPAEVREQARIFAPRYGDPAWPFHVISHNPSSTGDVMRWARFPDSLREQFRQASWFLVRFPIDHLFQARHGAAFRSRLSASRQFRTVNDWRRFAWWLDGRGIVTLGEVTVEDLLDYNRHVVKELGLARTTVTSLLIGLSRLHAYSSRYMPPQHRLVEPPWVDEGMDDYLPAASPLGENTTEPITPETMGALLIWAMRFVEVFALDILAADAERGRLVKVADAADAQSPSHQSSAALTKYLGELVSQGHPLPATGLYQPLDGSGVSTFVAGLTGTSRSRALSILAQPRWRKYAAANPGPCLLGTPVTGLLDGKPWHPGITFQQAATLKRHLVTCCFIIICYLTGMRIGEVLGLEHGCCPDPEGPDDGAKRFVIRGRDFKNARDEHGNHLSAGVVRETGWIAIPQVVTAIRLLERITGPGLLFDALAHDIRQPDQRGGRSLSSSTMANRIEYFVQWVNRYANEHGRVDETIERADGERLAPIRFRRTLAWHIARRPGGLVALAIQYGHMRTIVSSGYASRSRDGIHQLLDFETAHVVAEHLSDVHETLQDGQGISGPAARRLITAAAVEHQRFGGTVTTARQAKALLSDPTLNVFENKQAYLFCNWDRSKALCEVGRSASDAPSLDRCQSACANIARTDAHADQMEAASSTLLEQVSSGMLPPPIADRIQARAQRLQQLAAQHRAERITIERRTT
ncbi:hypothetical protein [Actinocorallia aurantiaca]|uniref:Integrase n=1 Tax=Actinocorallia aurantiaca TaxID=46204 RepID=A0ABN3UKN9_9ACTN